MKLEQTILSNLIYNEEYSRKVIPFLKSEYFSDSSEKIVFEEIQNFILKFKTIPSKESIEIELENRKVNDEVFQGCLQVLKSLGIEEDNQEWILEKTEKFCKDKAVYHAVLSGIHIIDGKDKDRGADAIPDILSKALAVSFDSSVGHDYTEDGDERYDFYHKKEKRIEFDLEHFNKITKGGLPPKSLNIAIAGCVHPETKIKVRIRV